MKTFYKYLSIALLLAACKATSATAETNPPTSVTPSISSLNILLAKTVNFGNMLEAPKEGDWGLTMQESFFDKVKEGGFTAIRLPISFSTHAAAAAPYTLEESFMKTRVDWAIEQAKKRNLAIIIDLHHYNELMTAPAANLERYLGLWKQIAERYRDMPSSVFFEALNEPNGALEPLWNDYQSQALAVIRKSNPTRAVIVGPTGWNSADRLKDLKLPPADQNLIVTFHNYTPFSFTHQGATWVSPTPPTGIVWPQNGVSFAAPWQNWSWGSTLKGDADGMNVTYTQGWAGVYFHSDADVTGFSKLNFKVDKTMKLSILCLEKNVQGQNPPSFSLEAQANVKITVEFSTCGNPNAIHDLFIQNNTPDAQPTFKLSNLELEGASGTQSIFGSSSREVSDYMQQAVIWGKANTRPIFMGEFGSFSAGEMPSRAAWTKFVRQEAEKNSLSWGYWELAAGFGVLDPKTNTFSTPLMDALMKN